MSEGGIRGNPPRAELGRPSAADRMQPGLGLDIAAGDCHAVAVITYRS